MAGKFSSYTHSAVFAELKVDEELGVARVTRVVSAIVAGLILNPKAAHSQILGGVVMGIGMALHEEGMIVDETDTEASPIGVKGLGEIGIIGVAVAISNAIFHAAGKRIRHFPITIDKILDVREND